MNGSPAVVFDGLTVTYGSVHALDNVTLSVEQGGSLGIVGESGSGKSTLLRAALGLLAPGAFVAAGEVRLCGRQTFALSSQERRCLCGTSIGIVFQDSRAHFTPVRTVGDQLTEAATAHGLNSATTYAEAVELLSRMGIEDPERVLSSRPFELSGGQGQRAGIACALALHPKALLLDEPTSALDAASQQKALVELERARKEEGCALVTVTHNFAVVGAIAEEVAVLRDGRVVEQGPVAQVLEHPRDSFTRELLVAVPRPLDELADLSDRVPAPGLGTSNESGKQKTLSSTAVLEIDGISKAYVSGKRSFPAVRDVTLSVVQGECVGLVGESGSGKTTLARVVAHLIDADSGCVRVAGRDLTSLTGRSLRSARGVIQMVFQDPVGSFDPRQTLGAGVMETLRLAGISRHECVRRCDELFEQCGLDPGFTQRRPHEVSGGQCQRAALARALASDPAVLVCDEATSALDVTAQSGIVALLRSLCRDRGLAVLFICHDLALVAAACDRVVVMDSGCIVESGRPLEVLRHPSHSATRALCAAVSLVGNRWQKMRERVSDYGECVQKN